MNDEKITLDLVIDVICIFRHIAKLCADAV